MPQRKVIDRKFHIEIERGAHVTEDRPVIIKTSNSQPIPDDEPLILFRARDILALQMLLSYRALCVFYKCTDYQLDALDLVIADFKKFGMDHPDRMKMPGATKGL